MALNQNYFESYEDLEVHKLMLEDEPRNQTYKDAIMNNKSYIKNKTVMDVGCGTGILSIFCAQAGAKKVYAVEASNLAKLAKEIVKENNFEDVIEVIQSKVEDLILPNNMKVDVIVSEWMGFYLLHEGMLDSVFAARDMFLKDDGQMFPETATIHIAPCSVPMLYKKWENVHGVSMSTFAKHLRENKGSKPEIINIHSEDLIAKETALCWIDLKEDTIADLDSYSLKHVAATSKTGLYQGLCVWFDCTFPNLSNDSDGSQVRLDTSPSSLPTHWKQAVIVLPQEQEMEEGEPIAFQLDMKRDHVNPRRYNLEVTLLDPDTTEHPLPCSCHMTKCILIKTFMQQQVEKTISEIAANNHGDSALIEEDIEDD
ncbi:arginine methyltransferase 8 [Aphomia sociella]